MSGIWEKLRAAFDSLSARERILVASAGALLALALVSVTVVRPLLGLGESVEQRLRAAEQQLLVV
ncbi:MAG: type II secretion system protein GspM, partial [Myxococcales bacterium]|nr:type II secretion system protein GspM [Myxococcales bacterium]